MIVVTIDLHSQGREPRGPQDHLAKLLIWNDGSGTRDLGNYAAILTTGEAPDSPFRVSAEQILAETHLERYPRTNRQQHICNLVRDVLRAMGDVDLPGVSA